MGIIRVVPTNHIITARGVGVAAVKGRKSYLHVPRRPPKLFKVQRPSFEEMDQAFLTESIFTTSAACPGCGADQGIANVLARALVWALPNVRWVNQNDQQGIGVKKIIFAKATGCYEVVTESGDSSNINFELLKDHIISVVSSAHLCFSDAPSAMIGFHGAYKNKVASGLEIEPSFFFFFGGDGALTIGQTSFFDFLQGHQGLAIIYNNRKFMNTGKQRSADTLKGENTATSPVGKEIPGCQDLHRDLIAEILAFNPAFFATASLAKPLDLFKKVVISTGVRGPSVILLDSVCPMGQGYGDNEGLAVAEKNLETGLTPLISYYGTPDGGHLVIDRLRQEELIGERVPVTESFRLSGGLKHLTQPKYSDLAMDTQREIDRRYKELLERARMVPNTKPRRPNEPKWKVVDGYTAPSPFLAEGEEPPIRDLFDF